MNSKDLNYLIKELKKSCADQEAYIGFYYIDDSGDSSYIKANKDGLKLFASNLIEASFRFDESGLKTSEIFKLNDSIYLNHSEFRFTNLELSNSAKNELEKPEEEYKKTFLDKIGCFIALIIALLTIISIIVGVVTILKWLF